MAPGRFEHGAFVAGRFVGVSNACGSIGGFMATSSPAWERLRCLGVKSRRGWAVPTSTVCGLSLAKKL